ncbi:unnamed protein product [Cylindrotheca closterium]|uniref:G-protein coupled receptors family 3 profile domain-containing protein n=1 Tax=Cylindrotheca closterium TaxID=2856 RepID=A0AAD2FX39_9STRA|nr:unnamed protein product [Cylindrotheca closterium]
MAANNILVFNIVVLSSFIIALTEASSPSSPQLRRQNYSLKRHHLIGRRRTQDDAENVVKNNDTTTSSSTTRNITFALIPKTIDNPFFDVSRDGCMDEAERIGGGVTCIYPGPATASVDEQVNLIRSLIQNKSVDGIAVSAIDANALVEVIEEATLAGIPVVTFDSDAAQTNRVSYIGTDNEAFGERLGKVLKQIQPESGTFRMVSIPEPNILQRERGTRRKLLEEGWLEAGAPSNMMGNSTLVVEQMFQFMQEDPTLTAIVPVMGAGMRSPIWHDFVMAYPDVLLVVADAMPNQLEYLNRAYCNGLVGQLPYEMGARSIQVLHDLYTGKSDPAEVPQFIATNVLEHLRIPLELPPLVKDYNLVGELRYVGYALFGIVATMATSFMGWAFVHRRMRVVKVAQPQFLIMVALGSLIMCSAILPLGFDDATSQVSDHPGITVCMTPVWLLIVGFSLTYSSLFAKIYRVNLIFKSGERFARVQMKEREVWIPLTSLLLANGVILLTWTLMDPLKYTRLDEEGLDGWDRPISSYGTCQSENSVPYLVPLGILNGVVLLFANWSAYEARSISSEFAESKYVAMAMASLFQALISAVPVLFLVQGSPQAFYMVFVFMIFVMSSAIILLIFIPKVVAYYEFKNQPAHLQQQAIERSIRDSGKKMRRSSVFRYSSWRLESDREMLSTLDNESSPELTTHHNFQQGSSGGVSESFIRASDDGQNKSSQMGRPFADSSEALTVSSWPGESNKPTTGGERQTISSISGSGSRSGLMSGTRSQHLTASSQSVAMSPVAEDGSSNEERKVIRIESTKSLKMKSLSDVDDDAATKKTVLPIAMNTVLPIAMNKSLSLSSMTEIMERNRAMWSKSLNTKQVSETDLANNKKKKDSEAEGKHPMKMTIIETKDKSGGKMSRMSSRMSSDDDSILSA